MNYGVELIYYVWHKFITFIFDNALIFDGVSIGYVMLSVIVLSILIRNLLAIPRKGQNINIGGKNANT